MKEQILKTRIKHKTGKYADWEKAANSFKPLLGEIVVYVPDDASDTRPTRLKVGDGEHFINELDFITSAAADNAGGEAGLTQIQTDYGQNDDTQIDYIKNRPFYALPPEHSFKFKAIKKFDPITWNGDISNNPAELIITPAEYVNGMKFFKVAEQTLNFDDLLDGQIYVSVPVDTGEMEVNYYYYPFKITSDIIMYQDNDFFVTEYCVLANIAGTLTLDVGGDTPLNAEFPEPGIYFLYMEEGNQIGYGSELSGAIDITSSTNLWTVPDALGTGTMLAYDKVYDSFLEKDILLNSSIGMHIISYDSDNSDGQCMSIIVNQDMFDNMGNSLVTLADGSWYLSMDGIPLLSSIKTPDIEIEGVIIEEAGVYLGYMNTETGNKDGVEVWLDHWISPERVFQIDPKFIPKNDIAIQSNWEQMDSEKSDYIKNKPFDYQYIYGYNFNEVQNSEIKVYFNSANYPNSYFGLVKDMVFEDGGYIKLESIYVNVNGTSKYLPSTEIYSSSSRSQYSISVSEDNDFITGSTTLMIYVKEPGNVDLYVNGNYYYLNFPKKGIYYLCAEDFGFYLEDIGYYYYFNADSNYQADWSQTNSYHPGFIRNKPNITTTSEINSYSSNPVSSSGVYYALGGRSSISTTGSVSSGSDSLVTSGGVYDALQNIKVTADSSVSSSSTNPIQSKAIYTALGNRTTLSFDTYPQSGSSNPITSGAVYTALGGSSISTTSNVQSNSSSLITSKGVYAALGNRTSLTFDDTPTSGSSDLMTSGAIYTALQNVEIDVDSEVTADSENPVSSAAIYSAIDKAKTIVDTEITEGSTNAISSGAVHTALQNIETDNEIIENSTNPVSGGAVHTALQNITIKEADTIDGYHFNVSTEIPTSDSVTDYTITFVI